MKRVDNELMKETILDAVIACKHEAAGVDVSLSQISSRAGISERTLNRYYPDKDLLLYEAAIKYLREQYDKLIKEYNAANTSKMNALERLVMLMKMRITSSQNDTANAVVFVRAFTTALRTAVYKKLPSSGCDEPARKLIISCIEDGIKDGSMRKDIDPVEMYLMLSSNFNGMMQRLIYMYSIDYSEDEHKKEILLVFEKYILMLEEFLSAEGRANKRQ